MVTTGSNTIGGSGTGAGNLISGNKLTGVELSGSSASNNVIAGNYIGTNAAGNATIGNGSRYDGVYINGAPNNIIGGTSAGRETSSPVTRIMAWKFSELARRTTSSKATTSAPTPPTAALGNTPDSGVFIYDASGNTIGGTSAAARNVISGNGLYGVSI